MTLIRNWRRCYKLYRVQLGLLIAFFGLAQMELLPMWEAQLRQGIHRIEQRLGSGSVRCPPDQTRPGSGGTQIK